MSNLFHVAIGVLFGWLMLAQCEAAPRVVLADEPKLTMIRGNHNTPQWWQGVEQRRPFCIGQHHVVTPTYFHPITGCTLDLSKEQTLDFSQVAPPGTVGVLAHGVLIISHGVGEETCDNMVFLGAGDTGQLRYSGQTIETDAGHWYTRPDGKLVARSAGGQRSNHTFTRTLVDFKLRLRMYPDGGQMWPAGCSYGINYEPGLWIVDDERGDQ